MIYIDGDDLEARHGLGRHTWTISAEDALEQSKVRTTVT